MRRVVRGLIAGLLVCAGLGGVPDAAEPDAVLAVIAGETITVERFEREMARRGGGRPGQYATVEQKRMLLDELIEFEALAAGAIAEGFDTSPEARALFKRLLVDLYKRERLSPALDELTVSEDEIAAHYAANRADYARPPRIQVALVYFALTSEAGEERKAAVEARVASALEQVAELDSKIRHFGNVARQNSDDRASRYKGGVIGWIDPATADSYKWDAAVIEAATALENPGDVAPPVWTDDGIYLVRLVDRDAGKELGLSMLRDGLRNQLLQQKRQQQLRAQMARLLSTIEVTVDEELLEAVDVPTASDVGSDQRVPPPLPGR